MAPSVQESVCVSQQVHNVGTETPTVSRSKHGSDHFGIPLIDKIKSRIQSGDKFYSLEFFPPRTKAGAVNLVSRLDRMREGNPLFVDITWGAGGNPGGDSETSSMKIAETSVQLLGLETMLHMTCVGAQAEDVTRHLDKAKRLGLRNILALRGDLPNVDEAWQYDADKFNYGTDLVRHIRSQYGGHFTICVAGYPAGHPEAESYDQDILHLKEKVEAGADFIITQLFFTAATFLQFVTDCRAAGITCPIVPGVLPIQSHDSLRHIVKLSKLAVPGDIADTVERLRDNAEAIQNYGVHLATQMVRELFQSGLAPGVHFYTLNKEVATTAILRNLGLMTEVARPLPFRQSGDARRWGGEGVRPVFWSQRPRSYVQRTRHWDQWPRTSWSPQSPLADLAEADLLSFQLTSASSAADLLAMWGAELGGEEEVWEVVRRHYAGSPAPGHPLVSALPWSRHGAAQLPAPELALLAAAGVLVTNSQAAVCNLPSQDPELGWGPPGGFISQKGYLEFLMRPDKLASLLQCARHYPGVSYQARTRDGGVAETNVEEAVTLSWGVFPGAELRAPAVACPATFPAWSRELLALLEVTWGGLYPATSTSRQVISTIANTYCHVWLVDNDYPRGNCLIRLLEESLTENHKLKFD